jgi:hypothetical protein
MTLSVIYETVKLGVIGSWNKETAIANTQKGAEWLSHRRVCQVCTGIVNQVDRVYIAASWQDED